MINNVLKIFQFRITKESQFFCELKIFSWPFPSRDQKHEIFFMFHFKHVYEALIFHIWCYRSLLLWRYQAKGGLPQYRAGIYVFQAIVNIHKNMSIHLFCPSPLSLIHLSHFLPLSFLHSIFSNSTHQLPTISELNGSIPAMVPEGALTLPLHFCSSPSCGAAVGVTKGSLHLRGQPTSSWESGMKLRVESERIREQQTCLFATKLTEKESNPFCFKANCWMGVFVQREHVILLCY